MKGIQQMPDGYLNRCTQPLNMRNIKTNRDWAGIFGNKRDEYR